MNYQDGFQDAMRAMLNFQCDMNVIGAQDECLVEWRELNEQEETEYAEGYLEGITAMVDLQLGEKLTITDAHARCEMYAVELAVWDGKGAKPRMQRRRLPTVVEE